MLCTDPTAAPGEWLTLLLGGVVVPAGGVRLAVAGVGGEVAVPRPARPLPAPHRPAQIFALRATHEPIGIAATAVVQECLAPVSLGSGDNS